MRFTVYFDGTGNNKDKHAPDGTQTNVARLYDLDMAKGTNLARNSGHNPQQYNPHERSGQSEKIYFDGVGSQAKTSARFLLEAATGRGAQERIEQAYDAIVAFHNKYPDQKIDVNIVGFSRGASQSRALANELIERGVPKLNGLGDTTGEFLIPPGQAHINKLGIFDTVATDGMYNTDTHMNKNLEISRNVDSTTHLIAMNEYRDTFRLTSALRNDDNARIEELKFAGAHSQVGGGYQDDILAAGPLAVMYDRLKLAGIDMKPMHQEDVKRIQQYNELIKAPEQVQQALIDSRLWRGEKVFSKDIGGSYHKVNNTPFPMERGMINVFGRQRRPFEHEIKGRGVIFENDDRLSRDGISRALESVSERLKSMGQETLSASLRVLGLETREQVANGNKGVYAELRAERKAKSREQVSMLSDELKASRPNAPYIKSLSLQPVPVPQSAQHGQQQDPKTQQRSDSLLAMEEKARSFNPSACVVEAGRKAISGLVVDMDEHHILQRVGQTDLFVIHDRRDVDPGRNLQVGKSTSIMHIEGIGDRAGTLAPKMVSDAALVNVMRR